MSRGGRREDPRKRRGPKRPPRPKSKLRLSTSWRKNAPARADTGASELLHDAETAGPVTEPEP